LRAQHHALLMRFPTDRRRSLGLAHRAPCHSHHWRWLEVHL